MTLQIQMTGTVISKKPQMQLTIKCPKWDITEAEVRQALNNLKKCKVAGPDGIPNDLLKIAEDSIIHYLVELFNEIFKSGLYPSERTKAIIQPIHKKGDTSNPDN